LLQLQVKLVNPSLLFQRDGSNVYMTLHLHKVDDQTSSHMHNINGPMPSGVIGDYVEWDSSEPLQLPAGWQIAGGDADDIRVCGAHPWQSWWLVFANGDSYGTAMCNMPSFIGACALIFEKCLPHSCHQDKNLDSSATASKRMRSC
jgi:hypothetical protein